MQPLKCQLCGAPAQIPPGQTLYQCPFCKNSFNVAGDVAPPPVAPPPPSYHHEIPHIIVIAPGASAPQSMPMPMPMPRRRSSGGGCVLAAVPALITVCVVLAIVGPNLVSNLGLFGFGWDGKSTLECTGNDDMTVSGITGNVTGGTVISASGNCTLHVKQCNLKGGVGIEADGNAHVFIEDGSLEGTQSAVEAGGNSHVEFHGTNVTGAKNRSANAKIVGP
jgi:hypothetical protein